MSRDEKDGAADAAALAALLASLGGCGAFELAPPRHARDRGGPFGETPLHMVAIMGDAAGARLLLDAGADPDAPGEHRFTPLHEAAMQGHAELVRLLLARGADPDAPNDWAEGAAGLTDDPATRAALDEWRRR